MSLISSPATRFCSTLSFVCESFLKNHQPGRSGGPPLAKVLYQEATDEHQQEYWHAETNHRTKDVIKRTFLAARKSLTALRQR